MRARRQEFTVHWFFVCRSRPLVGRDREIAEVAGAVTSSPLTTVTSVCVRSITPLPLSSYCSVLVKPSALTLEQIDAGLVSAFLEYLEDKRKNAAVTRNVRLAAIKSFFRFLEYRNPAALEQIRRVLAIPFKKTDALLVPYLLRDELQAVLDAPDPATHDGIAMAPCCMWRSVQDCASPS